MIIHIISCILMYMTDINGVTVILVNWCELTSDEIQSVTVCMMPSVS